VILLTAGWHRRSADELARRYDARIDPERPPQGIDEIAIGGADERQVAYFIEAPRALVVAEIFAVDSSGTLGVYPTPALTRPEELRASLEQIEALPVERLLVSHGEPVLTDARRAISRAIAEAQV
jgi:glyoxylase-like metal-dependent hydrolase (beta-lactamase superfamily II)